MMKLNVHQNSYQTADKTLVRGKFAFLTSPLQNKRRLWGYKYYASMKLASFTLCLSSLCEDNTCFCLSAILNPRNPRLSGKLL